MPFSADSDDEWSNFSPAVTLSWAFADALSVYARYAEGWKSGGFNGESDTLPAFLMAYDPEEVSSYELGLKSRWLDDRLQINAAAFRNDISDMQLCDLPCRCRGRPRWFRTPARRPCRASKSRYWHNRSTTCSSA